MTDAITRRLTRSDPARALRERVRSGELPRLHVQLAAWLGDPTALASGCGVWATPTPRLASGARTALLRAGLGQRLLVRVAADYASRVATTPEAHAAIAAAREWVACPCAAHADAAASAREQAAISAVSSATHAADYAAAHAAAYAAAAATATAAAVHAAHTAILACSAAAHAAAHAATPTAAAATAAAAHAAEREWQRQHLIAVLLEAA